MKDKVIPMCIGRQKSHRNIDALAEDWSPSILYCHLCIHTLFMCFNTVKEWLVSEFYEYKNAKENYSYIDCIVSC